MTDVVMPGLNGRDLVERFAPLHPHARIVLLSGYAGDTLAVQGVLDPLVTFLAKPFLPADLAPRIREGLDAPRPD